MLATLLSQYPQTILSLQTILMLLTVLLHIIFASGIARDVGELHRKAIPTRFIPGYAWVLATLIGGILVLAVYWLIHHSTLGRR